MKDIGGDKNNYNMTIRYFILLVTVFSCASCDVSSLLLINGQEGYDLSSECGTVGIGGSSFSTSVCLTYALNGRYCINGDSLKIEAYSNEDTIIDRYLEITKVEFKRNNTDIKDGSVMDFWCKLVAKRPDNGTTKKILILPSRFITCEGKPVITDTIVIQLKH